MTSEEREDFESAQQIVKAAKMTLREGDKCFEITRNRRVLGSGATVSNAVCAALASGDEHVQENALALHLAAAVSLDSSVVTGVIDNLFPADEGEGDDDENDDENDDEAPTMRPRR